MLLLLKFEKKPGMAAKSGRLPVGLADPALDSVRRLHFLHLGAFIDHRAENLKTLYLFALPLALCQQKLSLLFPKPD